MGRLADCRVRFEPAPVAGRCPHMQPPAYRPAAERPRKSPCGRRLRALASPMQSILDSVLLAMQLISRGDTDLWRIVALSLRVSATACMFGALAGLALGAWLAIARFPGHRVAVWATNTLLALPS